LLPEVLRKSLQLNPSVIPVSSVAVHQLSLAKRQLFDMMFSTFGVISWKTSRLLTSIVCIIAPHWKHLWPPGEDCTFSVGWCSSPHDEAKYYFLGEKCKAA
jgi:hypothetical protein